MRVVRKPFTCRACGTPCPPGNVGQKTCSLACRAVLQLADRVRDGQSRCSKCKEWKALDLFVTSTRRRFSGETYRLPHSYCKACNNLIFEERRRKRGQKKAVRRTPEEKRESGNLHQRVNNMRRRAEGKAGKKLIAQMLEDQGRRCAYCLCDIASLFHIDHKTPIVRGGTNDPENLHLTCPTCNLRKHDMTHEEFMASKKRPLLRAPRG